MKVSSAFFLAFSMVFVLLHEANAQGCPNALVDRVNRARPSWAQVVCDENLQWLAATHVIDQNKWYDANRYGATLYTPQCNLHSWKYKGGSCCYYNVGNDHRNKDCMWKAHERVAGWALNKNTDGGNVYEVSVGVNKKSRGDQDITAHGAMNSWLNSGSHNPVIVGTGGWSSLRRVGCAWNGKFANCMFQK